MQTCSAAPVFVKLSLHREDVYWISRILAGDNVLQFHCLLFIRAFGGRYSYRCMSFANAHVIHYLVGWLRVQRNLGTFAWFSLLWWISNIASCALFSSCNDSNRAPSWQLYVWRVSSRITAGTLIICSQWCSLFSERLSTSDRGQPHELCRQVHHKTDAAAVHQFWFRNNDRKKVIAAMTPPQIPRPN
jgi:hypothetical protein